MLKTCFYFSPDRAIPGIAQMHEIARGRLDGGNHRLGRFRLRRQDPSSAIHTGIGKPRLGRRHLAARYQRSLFTREHTRDHGRILIPRGAHGSGRQLFFGREVEKRRKSGKRADFPVRHQLRHGEHVNGRA